MKTRHIFGTLLALLLVLPSLAQTDPVLMWVNNKPILRSEFETIFRKNQKEATITREALDEYLVLFTNFKLKVTEAEELGMDTVSKFKEELAGYRKQLARPYLVDNEMTDKLIQEAYERMKYELRASHILVKCDIDAEPKDTLLAYQKALKFRDRIMKGEEFGKVASLKGGSDDPSVLKNKGDLGWFTAFMMVYNFENACYSMNVNEVSMPVRTRFGYHIIKLTGKRPARGTIRVAHILVASKDEDSAESKAQAKKKAEEILARIKAGGDFSTLANQFSDDPSSRTKGGELSPFSTGRMVEEFEEASFNLLKDGEISGIVKTAYGYHIIKRLELKPIDSFDDMKNTLKQKVQRDVRSQLPRKSFVAKLKVKYNFKEDKKAILPFYSVVDTNIFYGKWDVSKAAKLNKFMWSFNGKNYTQADFAQYLNKTQRRNQREDVSNFVLKQYEKWTSDEIIDFEDARLEELYPEFKMLMKEYRDGILLFELTDQKVWTKAIKDSVGLAGFYEKNKNNYLWPKRYVVDIFHCKDAAMAKALRKDLSKGKLNNEDLLKKYNKDSQLNLKIVSGKYNEDENEILKKNLPKAKGLSPDIAENGQVIIIRTLEIIEPTPKALNEAKGIITSDYQTYLEKEWLEGLRQKYPVKVEKDVLYSIK